MRLIETLEIKLDELSHKYGLVALKGGTEVEDMTFDELLFLRQIAINLPVIVKIGGPEARNDIRYCKSIHIDGVLAPMIESEYGLENFISAVKDIYNNHSLPYLAVNIETITAYHNLVAICSNPYFSYIQQVTVGRSDLSQSMKKGVDDEDVLYATAHIVKTAKLAGKVTSVGGQINPSNAELVKKVIDPDRINTRHLVFDCKKATNIAKSIQLGLEFELDLYRAFSNVEPGKSHIYHKRIAVTSDRLAVV
ncbi:MAG: aldolase/citrate lyase family protein [Spirochaetes bacterium]|nr:aldolase/citrate lyase family protein [Spirochaetota bacterium]